MNDDALIFNRDTYGVLAEEFGYEDAAELLNTFVADTARKIDLMSAPDACRDVLRREAHSIKSSAATLGFDQLSGLAFALEQAAASIPAPGLHAMTVAIRTVFDQSRKMATADIFANQQVK